ncbi:MAG: serine/threonine-protein kinase [Gemmatimonadales bacterium]|nr:serine/threonine-protein kinase [Gemmatimonadales bacterium]
MKTCPVCSTSYADDVKFCPNDGQTLRAAAPAANLVGQVVADRYHVIKKLGEGGMGQVYLAEHVKMGRRSAIKVMNPAMVHDPDAVARFNREASNASRITHPNVCAIYDFGETPDGLIYLAMEFIEGEPLTDLLERGGALALPRAVDVFLQAGDALQAAHDLGIVHRDLKPDNIMLTRRKGGGDTVKVVDFGIAKAVGGDESGQKVTKTGLVVGTPEFMSPEQLSGDTLDGRSDLYSLALVFYRMLTGKLPFEATTVQETMIKRLTDEPATLAASRPDLAFPPGLQPVLDTALARTPMERYQSVAKFAADVAAITGRPGPAAVPQTRAPADTEGKTQLLDATPGGATQRISVPKAPAAPPPPTRKRSFVPAVIAALVVLAGGGAWVVLNGGNRGTDGMAVDTAGQRSNDTVTMGGAQLGNRTTPPAPPAPPPPARTNALTNATATDSLDALFDTIDDLSGGMLRDAALDIYNAAGMSDQNRAMAAYLTANGFAKLDDRTRTCDWAQRAVALAPQSQPYRALRQEACR